MQAFSLICLLINSSLIVLLTQAVVWFLVPYFLFCCLQFLETNEQKKLLRLKVNNLSFCCRGKKFSEWKTKDEERVKRNEISNSNTLGPME